MTTSAVEPTKKKLRAFLSRFIRNPSFSDGEDIFAGGYVNSLFVMQLVMFVEGEFGITVEGEDLKLEHFNTVDHLAEFIARKQSEPPGP